MIVESKSKHSVASDIVLVLIWVGSLFMSSLISILRWEVWEEKKEKGRSKPKLFYC